MGPSADFSIPLLLTHPIFSGNNPPPEIWNWLGTYSSNVWNMVPACLMWLVWKEHNARTFEDIEKPIDLLKTLLTRTLFERSHIWGLMHYISMSDFLI